MKQIFILALLTLISKGVFSQNTAATDCTSLSGISKVICLTEKLKATLSKEQIALLQLDYSKGDAVRWSNFPQAFARPNRVGLSFGSLNAAQLAAAKALMAAVLSNGQPNEGYDELEGALAADDYFGEKTGKPGTFGANHYVMVFLGKPGTTGLWELMFGGHHFAFANTYKDGKLIGATPSFRGVEPMDLISVNGHAYQPLEQERQVFADVINSLNESEKGKVKLTNAFSDILLGPGEDGNFPATKSGIRIGNLSQEQQKLIIKAIALYVNDLDEATASALMKKYTAELADTYIAYTGSGTMSKPNDYIRLDGPNLWIEYSAQPSRDFAGTTHPHSVWRDHKTDYGSN